MWEVGTVVWFPGTFYGRTKQVYAPKWRTIESTETVVGMSADGGESWLRIRFTDGHEGSPYWIRRADAKLPGEPGYREPPSRSLHRIESETARMVAGAEWKRFQVLEDPKERTC